MVNRVINDCNERFYVHNKAVFAEDLDAIKSVMSANTPQNIKGISDTLNNKINVKKWMDSMANKVMKEGANAKFSQNIHHKDFLMKTGKKVLVEANPRDTHWSCGLSGKNRTGILDIENWPGKNKIQDNLTGEK